MVRRAKVRWSHVMQKCDGLPRLSAMTTWFTLKCDDMRRLNAIVSLAYKTIAL